MAAEPIHASHKPASTHYVAIKVEFHCHTIYSEDSLVSLQDLQADCRRKGIHKLAVTDHNTIQGAVRAKDLDPELFISGEEIKTLQGELLAFFVIDEVPAGLSAARTIDLLRSQGAFISVSHPFDRFREGHWSLADLQAIAPLVDAIEGFNSRCMLPSFNRQARDFAAEHHLLTTVGSDAHSLVEVGAASMELPDFTDAASLRAALMECRVHTRLSPAWVHFYSRYAAWRKRLLETTE